MCGEVEKDIAERIRKIAGAKRPLLRTTEIYHDLHIAGDDASELLEGVSKAYAASFQGFLFSEYFPGETEALWFHLKSCFGFPDRRRKSFTFGHLIAVVEQGAWFDPHPKGS